MVPRRGPFYESEFNPGNESTWNFGHFECLMESGPVESTPLCSPSPCVSATYMYLNVTFQDCEQHANKIRIVVEEDEDAIEQASDYEASIHDGDFAGTFRRLQHVCIRDFRVGISDSPFLRYWKSQKAAVFAVERIELDPPEVTDYDLLDSVVNHLRPKTTYDCFSWAECGYGREELKLLARKSFLNNLQTVRSMVSVLFSPHCCSRNSCRPTEPRQNSVFGFGPSLGARLLCQLPEL